MYRKEKSFYLARPLPAATMRRLAALLGETPSVSGQYHPYGGAIASKPNNATAFPHRRGVIGLLQVQAQWAAGDAGGRKRAMEWVDKVAILLEKMPGSRGGSGGTMAPITRACRLSNRHTTQICSLRIRDRRYDRWWRVRVCISPAFE